MILGLWHLLWRTHLQFLKEFIKENQRKLSSSASSEKYIAQVPFPAHPLFLSQSIKFIANKQ
jgi:hypothetical protein